MATAFPAYRGDEPYLFVCYSHQDSAVVFAELERLRRAGRHVYYDEGISPGREWTQELADAIDGCDRFLYFVSPSSAASRHCRNEVQYALERAKPIICVHLAATELPGGLQLALGSSQAIFKHELNAEDYARKVSEALELGAYPDGNLTRDRSPGRGARRSWRNLALGALAAAAFVVVLVLGYLDRPASPPAGTVTVAVMPFQSLSSGEPEPVLSDGLAIDIGNQLGKVADLRVSARSAVDAELDRGLSPIEVARRIGATHLVEGSLRFVDGRVLTNAQLVDVNTQTQVWAEAFEGAASEFPSLQSRLALDVAAALGATLTEDERGRIEAPLTADLEAYRLYSRFHFAGADPQDNRRAMALLEEAIEIDPEFTDAIGWLAHHRTWACWTGDRDSCAQVRPLAERAMALDPRSAMANWAMGRAEIVEGRVGLGVQRMHRAHVLAPSLQPLAVDLSTFAGLIGDLEESLAAAIQAVRLNPRDFEARWAVAVALRRLGDHERALRWVRQSLAELEDAPDDSRKGRVLGTLEWLEVGAGKLGLTDEQKRFAWANLSQVPMVRTGWGSRLLVAGEWVELRRWLEPLVAAQPMMRTGLDDIPLARSARTQYAFALAKLGDGDAARALFEESVTMNQRVLEWQPERPFSMLELAAIHAVRDEAEAAVAWLEQAYQAGMREYRYLLLDPMFETLSGDPRFEAILARMAEDAGRKLANVEALGLLDELERLMPAVSSAS